MRVIRWQEKTPPREQDVRRKLQQDGLVPHLWSNGPYDTYSVHSHAYEKVLYCLSGSIRFVLPDSPDASGQPTAVDLTPGDCLILPVGTRHSAYVGSAGVTCIEAARYTNERAARE